MPIYVYRCANCNGETEKRQGFSDAPLTTCETCGGQLRRVLQPAGVIFKGSGFYSTDYRNGAKGKKAAGESTDGKTDGKSAASAENGSGSKSEKSESTTAKSDGGESKSSPATSASKTE